MTGGVLSTWSTFINTKPSRVDVRGGIWTNTEFFYLQEGTLNIEGGVLALSRVNEFIYNVPDRQRSLIFNGGTLRALSDRPDFVPELGSTNVTIGSSGMTIDTQSFHVGVAAVLAESGGLTKTGTGTLTLTNANTYAGGTTVAEGTLRIGPGGSIPGDVQMMADSILTFDRADDYTFSGNTSGAGSLHHAGSGRLTLTDSNGHSGGTTIHSGTLQIGDGGSTGTLTGQVLNNGTLIFRRDDDYTFEGTISGSGTVRNEGSVLRLVQAQTFAGETRIDSGVVVLSTTQDFGLASSSLVTIGGAALDISNRQQRIAGLEGTGAVYSFGGSDGTLTLDVGVGETHTFSGVLGSNYADFSLAKDGAGTQILTGTNTDTGGTTITAGTLLIDGALTASSVTVGASGIVGGCGTIGGNLHFDSGGGILFDVVDSLMIDGTAVTFDGFGIENLIGLSAATPEGVYTVLDGSAAFNFANVLNLGSQNAFDLGGGKRAWFQEGSLQVVVIPEPSVAGFVSLSVLGLLAPRRRKPATSTES